MNSSSGFDSLRGFRIGQQVRVRGYKEIRTIVATYPDIAGRVRLDGPVPSMEVLVIWNVDDLVKLHEDNESHSE
jgi:hypothetical protein